MQIINQDLLSQLLKSSQTAEIHKLLYKVCELNASNPTNTNNPYFTNQLMEYIYKISNKDEEWKKAATNILTEVEKAYRANQNYKCHNNSYNRAICTHWSLFGNRTGW